jgi:non-heme chloroperoxidase
MRERCYLKLDRSLTIQIPGLITGGFLERRPVDDDEVARSTPHDLPTRTVAVDGAELHCFEFGTGHPVIFVHGSFADYRAWFLQVQPFAESFRFVTYSRRFHYPNAWTSDPAACNTALHGEDLAQLIRDLELGPATLVGQSTGGAVALHTALLHPDLVHSLVLSEPFCLSILLASPHGAELWGDYERQFWLPAAAAFDRCEHDRSLSILCNSILGAGSYESLPADVLPMLLQNAAGLRLEFHNTPYFSSFDMADATHIRAPTLLAEGDRSPAMFGVIADALASAIPDVTRRRFERVCHVPPFFAADAFNSEVFAFLDRVGKGS